MNDRKSNGVAAGGGGTTTGASGGTARRRQPAPRDPRGRHAGHRGADLAAECDQRGAGAAHRLGQRRQAHRGHHGSGRQDRGRARRRAFTDVTVGDPEVADVTPLTDHALSILGKKIGTTRVTIYGEGKRLVGLFDIEVSYEVSRLSAELARITGGSIRVSSVNGRIMLSGTSHDAATLDKAVVIARQFAPDIINTVQVAAAAAGRAGGALHRGQPYGRPRARSSVEHLRQEYADQYRLAGAQRSAAGHSPGRAIPAAAPDDQRSGRSGRRQEHPRQPAADLADRRCRRALGTPAPFGFLLGTHGSRRAFDRRRHQCARGEGPRPLAGGAQPGGAVGRHRKLPGRRRISRFRCRAGSAP